MTGVTLRDVAPGDLPVFFAHQLDADATAMAAFPARDRAGFDAHWAKILADASVVKKTILSGNDVAGSIVCWGDPEERQIASPCCARRSAPRSARPARSPSTS